jgi:IclR family pca regulon transcriptional regulator
MTVPLGTRVSAHSASIGRVLLAGLSTDRFEAYLAAMPASNVNAGQFRGLIDEVRSSGWATIEKSPGVGFCSIAVPVRDRDGGTIGGVNVVEYPPRNTPQAMVRKYLKLLRNAAEQIEAALHVSQHAVLALSDDPGGPPLIG